MLAKLQYIQEPLKNGTIVIIGSPKYSIPDLMSENANRTIFRVRKVRNWASEPEKSCYCLKRTMKCQELGIGAGKVVLLPKKD